MTMVKRKRGLYVLLIGIFIFSFAFYEFSFSNSVKAATTFPKGSSIGGIDIGEKTEDEAISLLLSAIEHWKNDGDFIVQTANGPVVIPYQNIQFDIQATVKELKNQIDKPWYAFFAKSEPQQLPLEVSVDVTDELLEKLGNSTDVKKTVQLIEDTISYLGEHQITAVSYNHNNVEEIIAETSWEIPSDYLFIDELVDELNGIVIPVHTSFSYLDSIADKVSYYSEAEGNFVVSMLYALLLQTNVDFVERHSQGTIPSYSEPGIEAKVSKNDDEDFIVYNPGSNEIRVTIEQTGNVLKMALRSKRQENTYRCSIENSLDVDYRTIKRYNKDLQPGHRQVLQPGKKGKRVDIYRITVSSNGQIIDKELISKDFYLPTPEIMLLAPAVEDAGDDTDTVENARTGEASATNEDGAFPADQTTNTTTNPGNTTNATGRNADNHAETTDDSIYEQPHVVK